MTAMPPDPLSTTPRMFLVGAGPGDPDLLTVKALRLLQTAQVVVFDRLVSPEIMDLIPATATRIYAGKQRSDHPLPQDQINALLVGLGQSGQLVVRLKGGDPFIFGRGSEEALALAQAGIAFQVVPGVSSASGCATYAGIPLTHRGLAQGVRMITGHTKDDRPADYDWARLADPDCTLAIYMGLNSLDHICKALIQGGLPADHPAAAVENGTTPRQRKIVGTLSTLPALTRHTLKPPTLILIGRVVALSDDLDWFRA